MMMVKRDQLAREPKVKEMTRERERDRLGWEKKKMERESINVFVVFVSWPILRNMSMSKALSPGHIPLAKKFPLSFNSCLETLIASFLSFIGSWVTHTHIWFPYILFWVDSLTVRICLMYVCASYSRTSLTTLIRG